MGLKILFHDGKSCLAIVNYETPGIEVVLWETVGKFWSASELKTSERFATDFH